MRVLISVQSECDAVQSSTSICRTREPWSSSRLDASVHDSSKCSAFDRSEDNNPIALVSVSKKRIDPVAPCSNEWIPSYLCHSDIEPASLRSRMMLTTCHRRLDQACLSTLTVHRGSSPCSFLQWTIVLSSTSDWNDYLLRRHIDRMRSSDFLLRFESTLPFGIAETLSSTEAAFNEAIVSNSLSRFRRFRRYRCSFRFPWLFFFFRSLCFTGDSWFSRWVVKSITWSSTSMEDREVGWWR